MKCPECENEVEELITDEPDPFAEEIHGVETIVIQCKNCYQQSAWDI